MKDDYEDIEKELSFEKQLKNYEQLIFIKLKVANSRNWSLTNFKRFISQFLLTINNEDQWTFDYECWLEGMDTDKYEHPLGWAIEFYQERWDNEKCMKSLNSLKS